MSGAGRRWRRPTLVVYLFACLGLVAALPLAVVGVREMHRWSASERRAADTKLALGAATLAREVGSMVAGHVRALETLAGEVEKHGIEGASVEDSLQVFRRRYGGFTVVYVADRRGRAVVSDPATSPDGIPIAGTDYSDRAYYRAMIASGKTTIGGVEMDRRSGVPNVHVAVPLAGPDGAVAGYVLGSLDLAAVGEVAAAVAAELPGTAIVVLDSEGRVLTHPGVADEAMRSLGGVALFAGDRGAPQLRSAVDERGVRSRGAAVAVAGLGLGWTVVAYRPWSAIDEQAGRAGRRILGLGLLVLLVGMALCAGLALWLARPIRNLARFAERLGQGQFEAPPVPRRWEPREVSALLEAMGQMGERIRDQRGELERTVDERTAQLRDTNLALERNLKELGRAQAQLGLADRMASVGSLAAGVAHEINNPLTYVLSNLGYAATQLGELADAAAGSDPEGARALAEIKEALEESHEGATRVRDIVRDLKQLSRSDESLTVNVDVAGVLDSALNLAWNEIRHRARLEKHYADVPPVLGNPGRLGQVLLNLVLNAAQAIPEGATDQHLIRVATARAPDGAVVIEVQDTGTGIRPEDLARIFDPFYTTKPVGQGTGLGLAISHRIVTMMGGRIEVASVVGHGSTFRVVLPPGPPERATPAAPAPASAPRKGRILIVDDDLAVGRALGQMVGAQHDVVVLSDGREALRRAIDERFDTIVCDLMMPELSGMELHRALATTRPALAARMVFVTGGAFTDEGREFVARVANQVVNKPCTSVELRAALAATLGPPA